MALLFAFWVKEKLLTAKGAEKRHEKGAEKTLVAVNNTALAPGSTWGQRWVISPPASVVTGAGVPPAEEILRQGLAAICANMIVPSSPQLPPRGLMVSHKAIAAPPSTEIFFSFPLREKRNPLPVRREEGSICPLRSYKLSGVGLIEPPGKETPLRHIHQPRAVGRNDLVGSHRGSQGIRPGQGRRPDGQAV